MIWGTHGVILWCAPLALPFFIILHTHHQRGVQEHPELSVGSNADGVEVRSVGNSPVLQETYLIEAFNLKVRKEKLCGEGRGWLVGGLSSYAIMTLSHNVPRTPRPPGRHRVHAPEPRGGARGAERHAPAAGGGAGPRDAAQPGAGADGRGARGGLPQAALPAGAPALPARDTGQPAPAPVPPPALRRGGRHPAGPRAARLPPPLAGAYPNGERRPIRSSNHEPSTIHFHFSHTLHRSCTSTWRRRCWWRAAPPRRTGATTR